MEELSDDARATEEGPSNPLASTTHPEMDLHGDFHVPSMDSVDEVARCLAVSLPNLVHRSLLDVCGRCGGGRAGWSDERPNVTAYSFRLTQTSHYAL